MSPIDIGRVGRTPPHPSSGATRAVKTCLPDIGSRRAHIIAAVFPLGAQVYASERSNPHPTDISSRRVHTPAPVRPSGAHRVTVETKEFSDLSNRAAQPALNIKDVSSRRAHNHRNPSSKPQSSDRPPKLQKFKNTKIQKYVKECRSIKKKKKIK
jgi:hypothetical protein